MTELVLHPQTRQDIDFLLAQPPHALLLLGPRGLGKMSVAGYLAGKLLNVEPERLANIAAAKFIRPAKERSISIDAVRELEHFMSLKIPGRGWRVAVVEDAHYLTPEAQNALLKTLEEPPAETLIILTSTSEQQLLLTIRSRTQAMQLKRPEADALQAYFAARGHAQSAINQALLMSGGLPGLMQALLDDDKTHPLAVAAQAARQLLQMETFERLVLVDSLAKQREGALDVLDVLQHMSHLALQQSAQKSAMQARHWQKILHASYDATDALQKNGQLKLVLTNLMLSM
jgi:DNA polymerase-3 subunit delta'